LFDCRTDVKAVIEQRAGYAVTLRFSERSLYDCRPVSLFGNASARGLGDELAMPIDRRRFREAPACRTPGSYSGGIHRGEGAFSTRDPPRM